MGVISTTDFVHWAEGKPGRRAKVCETECVCADWQVMETMLLPDDSVGGFMTCNPVTASANATLRELAANMIDAHIHRIIIVDGRNRPIGIVTTTDILAALARGTDHPSGD